MQNGCHQFTAALPAVADKQFQCANNNTECSVHNDRIMEQQQHPKCSHSSTRKVQSWENWMAALQSAYFFTRHALKGLPSGG